ncbi:MAG: response regulator transcription factor [Candidatus Didemnitutus sp.]|nr:response regulator transcription factor [Candidatus Didemnitutus sp.]
MNRIKTVIVDDEPLARDDLAGLLHADPEIEVVACCSDGDQALHAVRAHAPDLLFLDVQMPGLTGFDVLTELGAGARPHVVFVTAYSEYALRAFDVGAVDYVSKPFTRKRLADTLQRAKAVVRGGEQQRIWEHIDDIVQQIQKLRAATGVAAAPVGAPQPPAPAAEDETDRDGRLLFRSDGEIHVCAPADIRWVETVGDYVKIHLVEKSRLVRMTMLHLMEKLGPRNFVRIHRSTAVNLAHVRKVTPTQYGEYQVELNDGTKLKVSRTYMPALRASL